MKTQFIKFFNEKMFFCGLVIILCFSFATLIYSSGPEAPWDVNQDREVNVLDLVLVAQNFGTTNPVADVNGDGTVNVLDLVLVAQHFGESTTEEFTKIYWVNSTDGKIQRANLDGTNVEDLVHVDRASGVALDMSEGKMYWTVTSSVNEKIQRANLDGTNIETLITGKGFGIYSIALDTVGDKMYWTVKSKVNDKHKIQRANLDGSNIEDIVTGFSQRSEEGLIGPSGIALDISEGKMYWSDEGAGKIQRANLNGTNIENILQVGHVVNISLDLNSGKIYWPVWPNGWIQRANFDGSNVETLVTGLDRPNGIYVDSLNSKMYWTHRGKSKIQRANLDGTNIEDLVTGVSFTRAPVLGTR